MKLKKNLLYGSIIAFSAIGMMQAYPKFNQSNYSAILLDEIEATADDPAEPGLFDTKYLAREINKQDVLVNKTSTTTSTHTQTQQQGVSGTQTNENKQQNTHNQSETNTVSSSVTGGISTPIVKGEATVGGSHSNTEGNSETIGESESISNTENESIITTDSTTTTTKTQYSAWETHHQIVCEPDPNGPKKFCWPQGEHSISSCLHSSIDKFDTSYKKKN